MKKQKILALLLSLVLLLGVTGFAAMADGEDEITVSLRVEGLDKCLYYNTNCAFAAKEGANSVAGLLASMKDAEGFPKVEIEDGEYGAYIADIGGLAQASHGEMSGWFYMVDGEIPAIGISGYELEDGDDVVIFFGDPYGVGMQYPVVDTSRLLTDGIIKLTSKDTVYDEDWTATVEVRPIVGATVEYDKASMITDENGEISVPQYNQLAGPHYLQIGKHDGETGAPAVLRFAPEYKIFVPFADMVSGAWYTEAVAYCVIGGLFSGMGDNKFAPDTPMTTAQLLTVLYRIAGDSEPDGEFWYSPQLAWAVEAGIIEEGSFEADATVTRELFIYMFYKTAGLDGKTDMFKKAIIIAAEDYNEISEQYIGAIEWAVASGLIIGVGNHNEGLTIDPSGTVSRAVVCQMLMRYYS